MVPRGIDAVTTKLTFIPIIHPDEDVLENYAFYRLCEREACDLEEHLLVCEKCQDKLAQTEEYIRLMKGGTAAYVTELDGGAQPGARHRQQGSGWNAAAAAILLLTCMSALLSWRAPLGAPHAILLDALRGSSSGDISQAPSYQPLDLQIDLKEVQPAAGYHVEVVDAAGRRVWFGETPARITPGLPPGAYWVRLSTDTGKPLREYSLNIVPR
jgi:hypothetical protein